MRGAANPMRYTVRDDECLWTIARHHGVSFAALLQANPQLEDPDRLEPGDEVLIPGPDAPAGMKGLLSRARESFVGTVRRFGGAGDRMPQVIEVAQDQDGVFESGVNAGSISRFTGGKIGWPWCGRFVSWCYRQADLALPGGDQWAVAQLKATVRKLGQWRNPRDLEPGMICTFRARSHVELVVEPVHRNGRLAGYTTIGGNAAKSRDGRHGVAETFRPLGEIEGGGFPVRV